MSRSPTRLFFPAVNVTAGSCLLISALLIGVDVLLRNLFVMTIPGSNEIAGFSLGIASAWGIASCVYDRSHIRIDTIYGLCGPRIRLLLDVLGSSATAVILGVVSYYAYQMFAQSLESHSRTISELALPLAPIQALWALGFVVGTVTAIAIVFIDLRRLFDQARPLQDETPSVSY